MIRFRARIASGDVVRKGALLLCVVCPRKQARNLVDISEKYSEACELPRVRATNFESSAWGDFYEREAELPLVTAMAIYPEYRHPLSTWRPSEAMCVVEIETDDGLTGIGWCEDYCGAD